MGPLTTIELVSSSAAPQISEPDVSDREVRATARFEWLEQRLARCKLPALIIWGREDEVFDASTFAQRFKGLLPHAEGPHLVTGRHFLQEDSGPEIAALILEFLGRTPRTGNP